MAAHPIRTVLLADDDPAIRTVLEQTLVLAGYQVLAAEDGRKALAQYEAQAGAVDLLLTDLQMPALGGLDLARRLRLKNPDLPIIFMSGNSGQGEMPTNEEFPDHLYFRKPFPPSRLVAELSNRFPPSTQV